MSGARRGEVQVLVQYVQLLLVHNVRSVNCFLFYLSNPSSASAV